MSGAYSGMTIVAGMPSRSAWNATARPWLPALAAMTPVRRASGPSWSRRLAAPRSLNEPVIWRFSSFTKQRARELGERLRVRAGRLDDGVAEPEPGGLDGGDVDGAGQGVHQKGSAGSPSVGVIQPTGMSGVECA